MRIIFFILGLTCLIGAKGCNKKRSPDEDSLKGVKIIYNLPLNERNGQVINYQDSDMIYFLKDVVVYKIPYFFNKEAAMMGLIDDTMNFKVEKWDIRYRYFIYTKKQSFGYKFDSLSAKEGKKISLDIFLSEIPANQLNAFCLQTLQKDNFISSDSSSNDLLEKYLPANKMDSTLNDSTFLYFTHEPSLKNCPFSFSQQADSMKRMKLYKIRGLFNSRQRKDGTIIPAREMNFEIKPMPVEDKRGILDLIYRYRQNIQ